MILTREKVMIGEAASKFKAFLLVHITDNPFLANLPVLYPLKTSENLWFSGVFRGMKWDHWPEIGYRSSLKVYLQRHM